MNEELKKVLIRIIPFLFIIIGIFIAVKRKKVSKTDLYIQRPNSYTRFILWCLLFIVFIFLTEITLYRFDLLKIGEWKNTLLPSVFKIIGMVILAPIAEELIFRALLLHKLRQFKINKHVAILIQALIFVALHSLAFENTLSSYLTNAQRFTDAIIYAYAMYHTRSIYTPIALHAIGNSVAAIEQFII